MTASEINTLVDAASEAIGAGEWSTAKRKLTQAWAGLVGMPDQRHDTVELKWDRMQIKALMAECDKELGRASQGRTGGMRSIKFGGI